MHGSHICPGHTGTPAEKGPEKARSFRRFCCSRSRSNRRRLVPAAAREHKQPSAASARNAPVQQVLIKLVRTVPPRTVPPALVKAATRQLCLKLHFGLTSATCHLLQLSQSRSSDPAGAWRYVAMTVLRRCTALYTFVTVFAGTRHRVISCMRTGSHGSCYLWLAQPGHLGQIRPHVQ